ALSRDGISPASPADDATIIRRLTLDLAGRIPTAAESRAYLESTDPRKRVRLVDRLMASPGFVRHLATELDALMMAGVKGSLRDYLARALAEGRSWDRIFREVILPDATDAAQQGAAPFLRQRVKDLDRLATEVSTTFFGVNISCAQCHDHPLVSDWTQDHFYGMKAFLARTFENGEFLGERGYGVVTYKTTDGEERRARMMFLTGRVVDEPPGGEPSKEEQKQEKERLERAKKEKVPPPRPGFSARAQLVEVALSPGERDYFARSIVNRTWHRLFGRGLVMPLDQMHEANAPSHPELLAWLARDTAEHGYDLRRLIRGLVLSQCYARGSRWEGGEVPRASSFAVAAVRPLTPMQLATSLALATADPARLPADIQPEEAETRIEALEAGARGLAPAFGPAGDDRQIGVSEALLFNNGERIAQGLLTDAPDRLVGRLKAIEDPNQLIDVSVRNVLSRSPDDEELHALGSYLRDRADRPVEARRQLVWALLTCSEFRFNH
ncbi:MAG TPA: DUF1549 domain-containing protein, partial [Isosphaeraceae bacterium]